MKTIFLTGATGFVGRQVLSVLIAEGFTVHCLISGKTHIPELRQPQVSYTTIDFLKADFQEKIEDIFQQIKPYQLIHCAWYTEHKNYLMDPINTQWLEATKKLIDAFYAWGGKRFLGLGTCVEYDFDYIDDAPISVKTPLKGRTLYAACKIEVFQYLEALHQKRDIDFAWVRLFYIYGPYEKKERLIPYIYHQLKQGKQAVPKWGSAKRDYIYVKDLAQQIVAILKSTYIGALNAGTGQGYTIQSIFDSVGEIMEKKHLTSSNRNEVPINISEPASIIADNKEWVQIAADTPLTSLKQGLIETIHWHNLHSQIIKK